MTPENNDKPLFRVRSRFYPLVVAYSYPVRICGVFCVLLLMVRELAGGIAWLSGAEEAGVLSYIMAIAIPFLLTFCGPLFMSYLDYRAIVYHFYEDRVEFIQGFWVRERMSIPYRTLLEIVPEVNWAQKKYKVGNIRLAPESRMGDIKTMQQGHKIPDIYNPVKFAEKVTELVDAYKQRQYDAQRQSSS